MHVPSVILVTDRIYVKTRRHVEKVKSVLGRERFLFLAIVDGFPSGLGEESIADLNVSVIRGSVQDISNQIRQARNSSESAAVVALNQSAILPALAVQRLLGVPLRSGFIEACDKCQMRRLILRSGCSTGLDFREIVPGASAVDVQPLEAEGFIVKPAFGMSSCDVRFTRSWTEAKRLAESTDRARSWLPAHVIDALQPEVTRSDTRIIEPYVEGTEFSVDGWIFEDLFHAIVQHKLFMVKSTFIGDGVTISPPIPSKRLPDGYLGLNNKESTICEFARGVLRAIGFRRGVFHIEGRERQNGELVLIEVNPRAPGGSLWRSALLRTGYDLEAVDVNIQLGQAPLRNCCAVVHNYTLHYPFYARRPGKLLSWGDLASSQSSIGGLSIDFAAELRTSFREEDLNEEPYLAFAVAYDDTEQGILAKAKAVLELDPPHIADWEPHVE